MQSESSAPNVVEKKLNEVLGGMERAVDEQLDAMANLSDRDLMEIRQRRAAQLRQENQIRSTLISNGHGKVVELPSEKQLFEIYKESQSIVCLFYNHSEKRRMELLLKIMDSIAKSQIRLRFVTICSDRAPFLRKKQVISTPVEIIFIKEGSVLKHLDCDEWLRSEMPETAMESRLKELCEKFMKLKKRIVEN